MSDNAKTLTFVVIGLLALVIGMYSAPSTAEFDDSTLAGVNLTKDFDNPEAAKRLRIVRFDADADKVREFEVAEQDGLWSIPSKDGYPADAAKQMAEAANSLMDRKILHVASKSASDHEQYGVIDPLSAKLEIGQKGVGTRVTMSDAQNKPLADLIVGKSVRDAEGQRYVREAGRDAVYVIDIDPSKLTTDFENWIEKNLLKMKAWDLEQVEVKDYSAEMRPVMGNDGRVSLGVAMDPRSDLTLGYSDADGKWSPVKLASFDRKKGENGDYVEFKLKDDEELDDKTLNALKTALDDLKIMDVKRKPAGLSANLKAGEDFLNNREAFQDLITKGFAPTRSADGASQDILSSDGELVATMKNGTEYVLRFGNLTSVAGSQDKEQKDGEAGADVAAKGGKDKKDEKADKDKNDVHRYLFVMARFNKDAVKQPDLVKLPDLPAKSDAKPEDKADAKEGEAAADAKKDDVAKADEAAKDKDKPAETADAAKTAESAEKKDDAAAAKTEPDKELAKVMEQRAAIEKENQRKNDEYQALLKKGEENVKDLNLRFGDWYFVVNDDVFQKLRVSKDKVIKKKEQPKAAGEAGAPAPPAGIPLGLPAIPGTGAGK